MFEMQLGAGRNMQIPLMKYREYFFQDRFLRVHGRRGEKRSSPEMSTLLIPGSNTMPLRSAHRARLSLRANQRRFAGSLLSPLQGVLNFPEVVSGVVSGSRGSGMKHRERGVIHGGRLSLVSRTVPVRVCNSCRRKGTN